MIDDISEVQVLRSDDGSFIISGDHQALVIEREINELQSRTTVRSDIPVCGVTLVVSQDADNSSFAEMAVYFAKSKSSARCTSDESDSVNENHNSSIEVNIEMPDSYDIPCDVPLETNTEGNSSNAQTIEQRKLEKNSEGDSSEAQINEQMMLEKNTEDNLNEAQKSERMMLEERPSSDPSEPVSENADSDDSDSDWGNNFPVNMPAPNLSSSSLTQNNGASSAHPSSDANDDDDDQRSMHLRQVRPRSPRGSYSRALAMHPPIWKGTISLKNGHVDVDMRLIAGSTFIATACLLTSSYHTTIEITQKIPINKRVFKERYINNRNSDAVTLIALPSKGCDCHFNKIQAFQNFFVAKKFSGAVVCEKIKIRGVTYVIKFLPKFGLTVKHIRKLNPLLALHLTEESYLVIIIEPK